ncbi:MAG: hypothetical protein ACOYU3_08420 [Bacillota bacterium]
MQIFNNMLMLHTVKGNVAGWCGLNDGADGATVQVEIHGAPQGQMEVTLMTNSGEHALGMMESEGKHAQGNWSYPGGAKDVTGIRIAHKTVKYIIKGGKAGVQPNAPKESITPANTAPANAAPVPKAPANIAPANIPPAPKAAGIQAPEEQRAVPIPVVKEPAEKKLVIHEKEMGMDPQKYIPESRMEDRINPVLAQADMRLWGETDGYSYPKGVKRMMANEKRPTPVKPPRERIMPVRKEPPAVKEMPASGRSLFAQADMRLYGETDGNNYMKPVDPLPEPPQMVSPMMPPVAPIMPDMTMPEAPPAQANERIRELLAQAKEDLSVRPAQDLINEGAPLPLMDMPEKKEAPQSKEMPVNEEALPLMDMPVQKQEPMAGKGMATPELIEVLSLSDISKSGVEDGLMGEGSGRKGVLGKGAWWRVEQPGVQDWHYLAGELTAKNGARVRAIALKAECDELPEHLRGWAQRTEDYFVVLIDAKTGTVLPDDAC